MKSILVVFCALLTVILNLTFATNLNSSYVGEIIRKLCYFYHIDTLAIFRNTSYEDDLLNLTDLFQKLEDQMSLPQIHFIHFSTEELRFITNKESTLSIVLTRLGSLDILKTVAVRLNTMHISKLVIVFREAVVLEELKYLLNWLWKENFFKVLVIFEERTKNQNRIFTIDPYPSIKWLNRTDVVDIGKLFLETIKDFKKYYIETPFTEDVPRAFFYTRNGVRRLVGRNANIILLFAEQMNIDLVCQYQPEWDLQTVRKHLPNKNSELSLHSYSQFYLEKYEWSYPLDMLYFCIMVPFNRGVPKSEYFVIAFDFGTWIATGFSIVFVAAMMRYIHPNKQERNSKAWYFFRSLTLIMYSPNMAKRMNSPGIRQFVFFALVFILAFILSCFYSTYLTTFCTEKVFLPSIQTVEDLAEENLQIMVIDYELEIAQKHSHFGELFLKLLYPVPYFEAIKKMNNLDSDYSYCIQHDRYYYLEKQMRGLNHPVFRLGNICFGPHYLMFPMNQNSYLQIRLFEFFLRVTSAGLDQFWEEEAFRLAVAMKHSTLMVDRTEIVQPLGMEYFQYVFVGWCVGMVVSAMSFADEVSQKKYKNPS